MHKISKILLTLIFTVTALLTVSLNCFAEGMSVVDAENLFTASEKKALEDKINEIKDAYECDVVIVTVRSFGYKSAMSYADDFYDYNGYGLKNGGILLLISESEGEYWISTSGKAITVFDNQKLDDVDDKVYKELKEHDFYSAAQNFLSQSEKVLKSYVNGTPYVEASDVIAAVVIVLIIAIATGVISVLVMKNKMNNAKPQKTATAYQRQNSFNLTVSRDMFLYSTVRRVPRANSNNGRGGGGGRTHTGSSGRSHGGRGGRF